MPASSGWYSKRARSKYWTVAAVLDELLGERQAEGGHTAAGVEVLEEAVADVVAGFVEVDGLTAGQIEPARRCSISG